MRGLGLLLLGFVLGAGLGAGGLLLLDGDDDGGGAASPTSTTVEAIEAVEAGPQRFEADDVPFTFDYPSTFAPVAASDLPAGYVAILGISPVDFLDVRRTADTELTDDQIDTDLAAALVAPGVTVTSSEVRTIGSVTLHVFDVADARVDPPTESRLHFFRAAGRTWELACQWDAEGRATITDACDEMLASLEVTLD